MLKTTHTQLLNIGFLPGVVQKIHQHWEAEFSEFKASLIYIVNSRTGRVLQRDPV